LTISPKVLKETWGPAMLACALGAARQYGRDLWVCVDEWWHPQLHGHPMSRYRSALLLAYWMGASTIYTEGGDLFALDYGGGLALSEQGRVLKRVAHQYDHLVTDELLKGVDWIFLSGHTMPAETFEAIARRVRAGATCLLPTRMLPAAAQSQKWDDVNILPDGAGRWVSPRDWYSLHYEPFANGPCDRALREALEGALGPDDSLHYTFGDSRLIGRMINGDPDNLEFTVV
jgi:hypothetical protein